MRKNVLKRMLAFGLAVVVCTMSWTVEPKADDTLTEGDFKYTVLEDGTAEITKYVGVQGVQEIVVPEQIGGHEVTSIGRESFWGDGANTKSIIIPKSVTTIGALAFWQCDDLEKFTIPESVTTIGASAFDGCTSLKNIVIPKNVSTIGANPFSGCSIEAIEVAKENTVYHSESNCLLDSKGTLISAGKNFVIPDGVTRIGSNAFCQYQWLENITLPESVTVIDDCAFLGCINLKKVKLPDGITVIGFAAFESCSKLSEINMPLYLEKIGDYAFWKCSFQKLNFSSNLKSIGEDVFLGLSSLTEIQVDKGNTTYYSEGNCLINKDGTLLLGCINSVIPKSVMCIGRYAFSGCGFRHFTIPDGVEKIDFRAFYGCSGLSAIQLPESITSISDLAFESCNNLTTIYARSNPYVESWLGNSKIHDGGINKECKVVDDDIPELLMEQDYTYELLADGTVSITGYFGEDTELQIPQTLAGKKVTTIADYAFYPHTDLTKIVFPDGVMKIGSSVMTYGKVEVVIPDSVTNISLYTFPVFTKDSTTIHANSGSYAAAYAEECGYKLILDDVVTEPSEPAKPDTDTQQPTTQQQATTETTTTTETVGTTESVSTKESVTSATTEVVSSVAEVGTTVEIADANSTVRVTSASSENPTVEYVAPINKKTSEIQIPDSVIVNGITYKVTSVAKNTFSGNKKVKKIVIGKNVTSIGKNAFANCKNLKTIVVKTTKLTKKSIAKYVLKGTSKKLTIKVPKSKLMAYKKYFKGKGNKKVRVKK